MRNFLFIIVITTSIQCESDVNNDFGYQGQWPINTIKDSMINPGFGECPKAMGCECISDETCPDDAKCSELFRGNYCVPQIGAKVPRFQGYDQFGDMFDLYDLAYQDKPILIEISTPWPTSSKVLSSWRSYINEDIRDQKWWRDKFDTVRDIVNNDGAYWVHIMHLDENEDVITPNTVSNWYKKYPHDGVIILSDPEAKMKQWVRPTGYPCIILINEKMEMTIHSFRGVEEAFDGLLRYYDIDY